MKHSRPTPKERELPGESTFPQKLSSSLALIIIFLASTQLGLHFWPNSALVYGIRVDYLSPTLYFLDILIVFYLLIQSFTHSIKILNSKLIFVFPLLLTNLLFSTNPLATLSWSLHLVLYLLFILSLPRYFLQHTIYKILAFSLLFQVALGAAQVALGHSLQGPLYFLGERALSLMSPNVAKASLFGETILRAYGTFSHPNILAGWSVVALLIIIWLSRHRDPSSPSRTLLDRNSRLQTEKGSVATERSVLFGTLLTIVAVLLTQSLTALFVLFVIIIPMYFLKTRLSKAIYFLVLSFLIFNFSFFIYRPLSTSLSERLALQQTSLSVIAKYPLFGTGASSSISTYPDVSPSQRLLQPDHDSFTLLLSWFGVLGVVGLLIVFSQLPIQNTRYKILYTMFPLVPLLLFDHYFLTSPQGLFILLLYLRIMSLNKSVINSKL